LRRRPEAFIVSSRGRVSEGIKGRLGRRLPVGSVDALIGHRQSEYRYSSVRNPAPTTRVPPDTNQSMHNLARGPAQGLPGSVLHPISAPRRWQLQDRSVGKGDIAHNDAWLHHKPPSWRDAPTRRDKGELVKSPGPGTSLGMIEQLTDRHQQYRPAVCHRDSPGAWGQPLTARRAQ
jgi:hypothetical protein